MAGEIETKLRISAQDTSAKAFRDVAAAVETMSQRVTRSQRNMVAEHKAAANVFVESAQMVQTSIGKISGAFGIGLGIGAVVEAGKKAVTVFATVDEQARALAVQTRRSEEEIAGFYERVKQVAGAAAIDADTLRNSFDDLARAIGPEAGAAALPRLAMAAKAMKAPIADVVGLMEQMNDNLGIAADKAPAAFDMIQKGTEGTRTTAAGATKGLADLSLQMRGLGESGEKGLRSTLGLLVAIGKHAPSTEAAVASLQSLMDKVGTRKTDESLEKLGRVPMRAALDEAKRKHQDEFLVFLNEVDKALTNMATEASTPIASKMQYLQRLIKSPEDRQAIQSILEGMPEYRAIRDRTPAQEAGATDKAFETMKPGAASFLTKLSNAAAELLEAGGRAIWGTATTQHKSTEAEKLPAGRAFLPPTMGGPPGKTTSWWDWLNPISPAGAAEAPHGGFPVIQGPRPLIPSEPGSATERTAREQLEAIRRMERASLWGAAASGGAGGSSGASSGGASPSSGAGGGGTGRIAGGGRAGGGRTPGGGAGGSGQGNTPGGTAGGIRAVARSKKDQSAEAAFIRRLATEEGVDPDVAVAVAKSEGLAASWAGGDNGSSFGAFQAHFGGIARGMMKPGQGDAMAREGINAKDPAQKEAVYRWQLRYAKKHGWGEWFGAKRAGIGRRQGLDGRAPAPASAQHTSGPVGADTGPGWQWPFREQRHIGGTIDNSIKPPDSGSPGDAIKGPNQFEAPHGHGAFTEVQLEDFRRKAAEPVRVPVKFSYEDTRGIRDRGEAQGRRVFNREAKRSRYLSFSDVGVI